MVEIDSRLTLIAFTCGSFPHQTEKLLWTRFSYGS